MEWYRSYQRQGKECRETGNSFTIVGAPYITKDGVSHCDVIVCVPFKTFCHSSACREKRIREVRVK